jgi:hypothetical protein
MDSFVLVARDRRVAVWSAPTHQGWGEMPLASAWTCIRILF